MPVPGASTSPGISRVFIIVFAFGVAAYRVSQGAFLEASGLSGLGAGLVCLRLASTRPHWRWLAWVCFGVTAAACLIVFIRMRRQGLI